MVHGKLVNADSEHYWKSAAENKLCFRQCNDCQHIHFPPRYQCPKCWSDSLTWVNHSGEGVVYSFTIVHRAPTKEYAEKSPYVLAMIEMDAGPRMIANIIGDDAHGTAIGDKVHVCFEKRPDITVPQFRLAR
ncbi:MAG: hypothetical protein JW384_02897 [Nitrosomonadaceae bacterium]|nr:hypothetical protein [Nitrosomonadaceae bacterium]